MQLEFTDLAPAPRALYHASAQLSRGEPEDFRDFGTPTVVDALTIGSGETISVFHKRVLDL